MVFQNKEIKFMANLSLIFIKIAMNRTYNVKKDKKKNEDNCKKKLNSNPSLSH